MLKIKRKLKKIGIFPLSTSKTICPLVRAYTIWRKRKVFAILKKYEFLRSLWLKKMKILQIFGNWTRKNIPDQQQIDQFRKSQKSAKSLHSNTIFQRKYSSLILTIIRPHFTVPIVYMYTEKSVYPHQNLLKGQSHEIKVCFFWS